MAKTLSERYLAVWHVLEICAGICGGNVIDPDYRMTWWTWSLQFIILVFFTISGYTTYTVYTKDRDWTAVLQSLCTVSSGVLGYCKLLNGIAKRKSFQLPGRLLKAIYVEYETKGTDYRLCLDKNITRAKTMIKVLVAVYVSVTIAFCLTPVYFYVVHKKRLFILHFNVPGIDPTTNTGYITLNIMHLFCLFFGIFGNFAGDAIFFLTVCSTPMLKDIMICKFQYLNKLLMADAAEIDHQEIKKSFKDVLQWHQQYLVILEATKDQGFWAILAQMACNGFGIIIALFCIMMGRWPGGQAYFIYAGVILYIYCALGTIVETTNEDIIDACYCEVDWYKLAVPEQKMLIVMLRMSQAATSLDIAGTTPLSVNVAVQLSKLVYTITMMLINFLDEN